MHTAKIIWLIPLLSMSITLSPDSTESRFGVAFGSGSYSMISRDCHGNSIGAKEVPFVAGSVSFERGISNNARFGIRIDGFRRGVTRTVGDVESFELNPSKAKFGLDDVSMGVMLTPMVDVEQKHFGIGFGVSVPTKSLSIADERFSKSQLAARLRLGRLDRVHIEGSRGYNSPFAAGGGFLDLGVGFPLSRGLGRLWIGVDQMPYEAAGILVKTTIPLSREIFLSGTGRYARARTITTESAWSVGLSYRWRD